MQAQEHPIARVDTLRRAPMVTARLAICGLACVGLMAVLAPAWMGSSPRLVYNPSDSAPRGFYAVRLAAPRPGDWVVTRLPADVMRFAAKRAYLPAGVSVLKRVAAVSGDHVCVQADDVRINGLVRATVQATDRRGRALSAWRGCRALQSNELFLLNADRSASFDSRYFGPIARHAVYGTATPLWTWEPSVGCIGAVASGEPTPPEVRARVAQGCEP